MESDADLITEQIRMTVAQETDNSDDVRFHDSCSSSLATTTPTDDCDVNNMATQSESGIDNLGPSEDMLLDHIGGQSIVSVPIVASHEEIATPSSSLPVSNATGLGTGDDIIINTQSQVSLRRSPKGQTQTELVQPRNMNQRQTAIFRSNVRGVLHKITKAPKRMECEMDMISEQIRMAVAQAAGHQDDLQFQNTSNSTLAVVSVDGCDVMQDIVASSEPDIDNLASSADVLLEHTRHHVAVGVPIVANHEEIETPSLDACVSDASMLGTTAVAVLNTASSLQSDMSPKEQMRRERVRQRKIAQRQSAAFRERERLKAKERMKTLRNDPVYRYHERQRDRERRKTARLNNQAQRARERERDRIRKSISRSLQAERKRNQVHLEGFQLLLGVSDSEEGEGQNEGLVWENGSPPQT